MEKGYRFGESFGGKIGEIALKSSEAVSRLGKESGSSRIVGTCSVYKLRYTPEFAVIVGDIIFLEYDKYFLFFL